MTTMRKELQRLSETLVLRGVAMLALGVGALLWPEPLLIATLLTALVHRRAELRPRLCAAQK